MQIQCKKQIWIKVCSFIHSLHLFMLTWSGSGSWKLENQEETHAVTGKNVSHS